MLTGENGILTQAQKAKEETENAQDDEENMLANYESYLNSYSGENTEFTDSLGNKVVVPAGFRVVNPGDNVEDGIIIEDVTHKATAGSQFVWIPVGTGIKKNDGTTFDIKLSRYTFEDTTGKATDQGSDIINNYYKEQNVGNGNITAKENIESEDVGFRKSAIDNGGYYIGRYEARTTTKRNTKEDKLTQVTVDVEDYVYNYVTQNQAANLSQNMYADSKFKSDLVNSYAWSTALVFIQECSNNKVYSLQNSLNTGNLALTGTKNDTQCNIYDMASNCCEWTTETCSYSGFPCVRAGGVYNDDTYFASKRSSLDVDLCQVFRHIFLRIYIFFQASLE